MTVLDEARADHAGLICALMPRSDDARSRVRETGGALSVIMRAVRIMSAQPVPIRKSLPVADDPRWARVLARDRTADGQFWYSVTTTGVYCRPSCPSRTANPKNVTLHD